MLVSFFFFNDTATTEIYTLSLHDALPIWMASARQIAAPMPRVPPVIKATRPSSLLPARVTLVASCVVAIRDRKSTRLNSSHANISYAVFCLKKKKKKAHQSTHQSFTQSYT